MTMFATLIPYALYSSTGFSSSYLGTDRLCWQLQLTRQSSCNPSCCNLEVFPDQIDLTDQSRLHLVRLHLLLHPLTSVFSLLSRGDKRSWLVLQLPVYSTGRQVCISLPNAHSFQSGPKAKEWKGREKSTGQKKEEGRKEEKDIGRTCYTCCTDTHNRWFRTYHSPYTVEPLNKGHFGENINSAVLSFYGEVVLFSEVLNVLEL